jgi:alkylated DNA nucleotide flippase Atl1
VSGEDDEAVVDDGRAAGDARVVGRVGEHSVERYTTKYFRVIRHLPMLHVQHLPTQMRSIGVMRHREGSYNTKIICCVNRPGTDVMIF